MLNRQVFNISSTIEQFDELQISHMDFSDLKRMMESRRDFTMMRDLKTGMILNTNPTSKEESNCSYRIVFMLSDTFDRFGSNREGVSQIDEEVVYDSANDDLIVKTGANAMAARTTIKDEIARVVKGNNERFLRNCFREEILELICMLVKDDESINGRNNKSLKVNALALSITSLEDVKEEEEAKILQ